LPLVFRHCKECLSAKGSALANATRKTQNQGASVPRPMNMERRQTRIQTAAGQYKNNL